MNYPKDELEFRVAWSHCAGAQVALKAVQSSIEDAAARAFVAGKDELASALRGQAREIAKQNAEKSAELQGYIDEDAQRQKAQTEEWAARMRAKARKCVMPKRKIELTKPAGQNQGNRP